MHPKTNEDHIIEEHRHIDPYQVAKELGIFEEYDVPCDVTVENIAERVVQNREKYKAKFEKKKAAQDKYYEEDKNYISEL